MYVLSYAVDVFMFVHLHLG